MSTTDPDPDVDSAKRRSRRPKHSGRPIDALMEVFGGYRAFCEKTKINSKTVSSWLTRGYIPPGNIMPDNWTIIVKAAKEHEVPDITYEMLASLAPPAEDGAKQQDAPAPPPV